MQLLIVVLIILLTNNVKCDLRNVSAESLNITSVDELFTGENDINSLIPSSYSGPYIETCTPNQVEYKYFPISGSILQFKVQAQHDVHVILTESPGGNSPSYEIIIGGWDNTRSSVREKGIIVATVRSLGILKECEYQRFCIRWDNSTVRVGFDDSSSPFLSYDVGKSVNVNFFGIHTGYGANGNWIF